MVQWKIFDAYFSRQANKKFSTFQFRIIELCILLFHLQRNPFWTMDQKPRLKQSHPLNLIILLLHDCFSGITMDLYSIMNSFLQPILADHHSLWHLKFYGLESILLQLAPGCTPMMIGRSHGPQLPLFVEFSAAQQKSH